MNFFCLDYKELRMPLLRSNLYFAYLQRNLSASQPYAIGFEIQVPYFSKKTSTVTPVSFTKIEVEACAHTNLCRGVVYNFEIEKNTDYLLFYYRDVDEYGVAIGNRVPASFIIGRVENATTFYIDVICSGNVHIKRNSADMDLHKNIHSGKDLLCMVEVVARTKGCNLIELSALPTVLTYYPRLGYRHINTCNDPVGVLDKPPSDIHTKITDYYADANWMQFMRHLHINNFNTARTSASFFYRATCDDDNITDAEFARANCGAEGFLMRKCLPVLTASTASSTTDPFIKAIDLVSNECEVRYKTSHKLVGVHLAINPVNPKTFITTIKRNSNSKRPRDLSFAFRDWISDRHESENTADPAVVQTLAGEYKEYLDDFSKEYNKSARTASRPTSTRNLEEYAKRFRGGKKI